MTDELRDVEIAMDSNNLYREETFTDRRVGSLQQLTPITASGAPDTGRSVLYVGQTQVLTPAGALPLSFEVPAKSLDEAVTRFGELAQQALANTIRKLDEMRREQASSIIVPGSAPPGGLGGRGLR